MKKGIYVGSLLDFTPLVVCPDVSTWIFIDSMPFCDSGQICNFQVNNGVTESLENPELYFKSMDKIVSLLNMVCVSDFNSIRTYRNKDVTLHYLYNTYFPKDLNTEQRDLCSQCNVVYFCGTKVPHSIIDNLSYPVSLRSYWNLNFCGLDKIIPRTQRELINIRPDFPYYFNVEVEQDWNIDESNLTIDYEYICI